MINSNDTKNIYIYIYINKKIIINKIIILLL